MAVIVGMFHSPSDRRSKSAAGVIAGTGERTKSLSLRVTIQSASINAADAA